MCNAAEPQAPQMPSPRRVLWIWVLLSVPVGPALAYLASLTDQTAVFWFVAAAWALGTAAAVLPDLPRWQRDARLLLASGFGLLCTAVAAAAAYVALFALIVVACEFGGRCLS